jgi:hypothetical protein
MRIKNIKRKKALLGLMVVFCLTTIVAAQVLSNYLNASWNVSAETPLVATWVEAPNPSIDYYIGIDYTYYISLENLAYQTVNGTLEMILTAGAESDFTATVNGTGIAPLSPIVFTISGESTQYFEFVIGFLTFDTTVSITLRFEGEVM